MTYKTAYILPRSHRYLILVFLSVLQSLTRHLITMAPTLLPLNIVTPSGSKSRAYAPPNASLADLRSILVKDAIIKPSTKFHVDGVVISGSAEVHMQWAEIIREIHVCDGEAPSVYHAFNANLNSIPYSGTR
ncbi:hypothetical protein BC629DRAFT_182107 [Irpex lacteus]|nr:hypothetical protein BC629DRAFT_182107 [Irpex lacteus]